MPARAIAAALALTCLASAYAGISFSHNLFVAGNMTAANSDVEGRLAVGGNANLSNYGVGSSLSNSNGSRDDLIVGNHLTFSNGQVFGGNIRYGSTATLNAVGLPHGNAAQGSPLDFAATASQYTAYSSQFAALASTGGIIYQPWNAIELTGSNAGLNVFNILGSKLSAANTLKISAPAGSTVLINVDGSAVQFQNAGQLLAGGIDASRILFNFHSASNLTISGIGVQGSVLAPSAHLAFANGQINGAGAVASYNGNGEWHQVGFLGDIAAPIPVPAPAAAVLGLIGLSFASRGKRRSA